MTLAHRRLAIVIPVTIALTLTVAACSSGGASPSPSAAASDSPAPSAVPSTAPSSSASPTASVAASPSSATACATLQQAVTPPTDRLTDLTVATTASSDRLTFVFGDAALTNPGGPPAGSLAVARPPFTQAGSGAPIAVTGEHVLQLRFTGMSLQNDAAEEMFTGPTELTPNFPALRKAVQFEASEGQMGWYIGYDGTGCVALGHDGNKVTLTIDHP